MSTLFRIIMILDMKPWSQRIQRHDAHRMQAIERYARVFGPLEYNVTIGGVEFVFMDAQALDGWSEHCSDFGTSNKEYIAELLTSFFDYWASCHDYNRAVTSVRTGGYLSKDEKDWTRRIGNERHLICIEDPFEITHDLGRVVDRHSIRVLQDEFKRAARILRQDSNPAVALFEPFIRDKV